MFCAIIGAGGAGSMLGIGGQRPTSERDEEEEEEEEDEDEDEEE